MKQVTSRAAIIAVPTAVTGFYGQSVLYPGFGHVAGFWASTGIMVGLSALLYVIFRRKDWLQAPGLNCSSARARAGPDSIGGTGRSPFPVINS